MTRVFNKNIIPQKEGSKERRNKICINESSAKIILTTKTLIKKRFIFLEIRNILCNENNSINIFAPNKNGYAFNVVEVFEGGFLIKIKNTSAKRNSDIEFDYCLT